MRRSAEVSHQQDLFRYGNHRDTFSSGRRWSTESAASKWLPKTQAFCFFVGCTSSTGKCPVAVRPKAVTTAECYLVTGMMRPHVSRGEGSIAASRCTRGWPRAGDRCRPTLLLLTQCHRCILHQNGGRVLNERHQKCRKSFETVAQRNAKLEREIDRVAGEEKIFENAA